jgi:hypothetical protein
MKYINGDGFEDKKNSRLFYLFESDSDEVAIGVQT